MKPTLFPFSIFGSRARGGKLAGAMICLLVVHTAFAQLVINTNSQSYFDPGPPAIPTIDATAFDNESVFSATYNVFINNNVIYCEPWWGTLFYTNNGEMMVNAPFTGTGTLDSLTTGVGFKFDLQQNNSNVTNSMAGTFYNAGQIDCDSVLDGNNESGGVLEPFTIGECVVSATNIIIPGNIEVGLNGLLNLTGQYVDLSHGVMTMEQGLSASNNVNGAILSEGEGFDTNGDWSPGQDLTPTTAVSSFPDFLFLTNSTPYFAVEGGPCNFNYRCACVQNENSNVSYSVYIAPAAFNNEGALIQWAGTYIDPASGNNVTNYLYLYHFYFSPTVTNFGPIVEFGAPPTELDQLFYEFGTPFFRNFVWSQSAPIAGLGPANTPNFPSVFTDNTLTNIYEYFNADMVATTVGTNVSGTNPYGALTNMPNLVNITGSQELNLALTQITGENYISLVATNQFDGSPGALINSPFYDINLGVTNGMMTVSNLVAQNVPFWGGFLQEWSTSWTNTDANGNNNDIRVLLVNSDLTPTIFPQVLNLTLNATNSLVISDILNVETSLYATPTSLTLTTNGVGAGANSPEGELNLENANSTTWSWGASFPNLLWLTNNGGIIIPNFSSFIGNSNIVTVISNTPAVAATATLSEAGTNATINGTVTIGSTIYTFTNTAITSKTPAYAVEIGKTFDATMTNLIAAINASAGAAKVYGTNGSYFSNGIVSAGSLINHQFTVAALQPGPGANVTPVSATTTNLVWNGSTLSGGTNAILASTNITPSAVAYGAFISTGTFMDQGSTIWANNFLGTGVFSNGVGSFTLTASTATLTNCSLTAGGAISITANTLLASNIVLQAGRSLTLDVTDWLSDGGVTNGNMWSVNSTNSTGFNAQGLILPILPTNNSPGLNNLLGTTINLQAPAPAKEVFSTWAGQNYGATPLGYTTNNVAIGQLILNAAGRGSSFYFSGTSTSAGVTNAIYVDRLILEDFAALTNNFGLNKIAAININTNMVIYYADALSSGQDVSYLINGFNTNRLVWVPSYTGFFSSTNLVYPDGTTNAVNNGLIQDPNLDSNGNGIPNYEDPDPFFATSEVNFKFAITNISGAIGRLTWDSIPSATNTVYYTTNMMPSTWTVVTNFVSPSAVPPVGGWPITNIVYEPLHGSPHGYYRVGVSPNNADVYGQ